MNRYKTSVVVFLLSGVMGLAIAAEPTSDQVPVASVPVTSVSVASAPHSDAQDYSSEYINPLLYAMAHNIASEPHYAQQLCNLPGYTCRPIRPGDTWASLWPNYHTRQMIMRLNRTNVALSYLSWVLVPKDTKHLSYMALSPMPYYRKPTGHKVIVVDLGLFAFGAYDKTGKLVYWGPASSGAVTCPGTGGSCLTVVGDYKVYRKQGVDCISHTYPLETKGGATMPYCMHFYKGFAIHGSTLAGFYNHSQGCVRLFYDDAKWLNTEFAQVGTAVFVKRV